ncbi:uncharacterized protein LOC141666232 [Apium graveolens]|uniref:uncharacterized protein LOC141666232 n=1 Tax=Apium graveolens TaxID=4045 RepID=UPI003D794EF4
MKKLVYALILASRKLRPYFQAHRIEVRTAYPLRQVLHKPESSGRMLKWAVELGQFEWKYMPRTAIKGQALADFLLEFDYEIDGKALVAVHPSPPEEVLEEFPHPWWVLHVDGTVNNGGAGACIVLVSPEGHHLMSAIHFKFYAINNDAYYEALINGLKITLEMRVRNLIAKSDSDILEEIRESSQLKLAAYQQRAARYYNRKVKGQLLKVGDLVLRKVMPNTKVPQYGVFGANW